MSTFVLCERSWRLLSAILWTRHMPMLFTRRVLSLAAYRLGMTSLVRQVIRTQRGGALCHYRY